MTSVMLPPDGEARRQPTAPRVEVPQAVHGVDARAGGRGPVAPRHEGDAAGERLPQLAQRGRRGRALRGGRHADRHRARGEVPGEGGHLRDRHLRPEVQDPAAGRRQDESGHLEPEAVRLAGQRREDDEEPGGPLLQRHPQGAEQVTDPLREEVLVADLQLVLLPALPDRADERPDALLEELDRAHVGPVGEELAREAIPVERFHVAEETRDVLGRAGHGRRERRGGGGGAALEQPRDRLLGGAHHLAGAVAEGECLSDPAETRHRGDRVHTVAGGLALRHREAVAALPGAQRLDRDTGGPRQSADRKPGAVLGLLRPGWHHPADSTGYCTASSSKPRHKVRRHAGPVSARSISATAKGTTAVFPRPLTSRTSRGPRR